MNSEIFLTILVTGIKTAVIFSLSAYFFYRWNHQDKKYKTDFPYLMAWITFFFAIGKIIDIIMYYQFQNDAQVVYHPNTPEFTLLKIRFLIAPGLVSIPFLILNLVVWLADKKKQQIIIGTLWTATALTLIGTAQDYDQILMRNTITLLPIILFLTLTFIITHHQKRLPEINSLLIAIGFISFTIAQVLRPIFFAMGDGTYGLTWVAELIELSCFCIIAIGFITPAPYNDEDHLALEKSKMEQERNEMKVERIQEKIEIIAK